MCVWWNFEGMLHFELVPDGHTVNTKFYAQQQQWVCDVTCNWSIEDVYSYSMTISPENTANVTKYKLGELDRLEALLQPVYSLDLAPSNYHLFHDMTRFLQRWRFNNVNKVEEGAGGFFAFKLAKWYKHGIELLVQRWQQTIEYDCVYFKEQMLYVICLNY